MFYKINQTIKAFLKIRYIIFCSLFVGAVNISFAQIHPKELDLQFKKFRNLRNVTVTNAEGSIDFKVDTFINSQGKPERIMLVGKIYNESLGENLITKLGLQREKNGFKHSSTTEEDLSNKYNTNSYEVYSKGTQYAKYGVNKRTETKYNSAGVTETTEYYVILLEIGDISRQATGKSQAFNF